MRRAFYSCEGFTREVISLLREEPGSGDLILVDDNSNFWGQEFHGAKVVSFEDLLSSEHRDRKVTVSIADPKVRAKVVEKCERAGLLFASVFAPSYIAGDNVEIGDGAILCDNTIITADAKIGRHFQANIYSYVAHDCIIGDFVTFAPRVSCNGRVVIEDFAYIGTGAVLRQGTNDKPLTVGRGAVVGMGAVVTKDVAAGSVVVGNPARELKRRDPES